MKVELDIATLGEYLNYKMQEKRLSYRDVAPELKMNTATLSRIVNGKGFGLRWVIPIAKWCKLTPTQLWELLEHIKG